MSDFTIAQLLLLQFVLILINAVFACAEIAIISINDNKLKKLSDNGNKKATRLLTLTNEPAKFLATIQVGITLAGFLASAFAADNFSERIVNWLISLGLTMSAASLDVLAVIGITLILSYVTLILGELVPKRIAMQHAEKIGLAISGLIFIIAKIFAPIVWLLTSSTNAVLRLMGINPNQVNDTVSEEEIRIMVDAGSQGGTIDDIEQKMIHNIFDFDDKRVQKVMTHRLDVAFINVNDVLNVWENIILNTRFSVYPVYDKNTDDIIGTLSIKDYFKYKALSKNDLLNKAIKPAQFIKGTMHTDDLFVMMQKKRNHFAVVIDEYGGMQGIITMNDLLEQIVGELENDSTLPPSQPAITQLEDNVWIIKGWALIEDVASSLKMTFDGDHYDTFAGFLLHVIGAIPNDKEDLSISYKNLDITITDIKNRTIEEARVKVN